jgi:hypothetical protein
VGSTGAGPGPGKVLGTPKANGDTQSQTQGWRDEAVFGSQNRIKGRAWMERELGAVASGWHCHPLL